MAETGLPKPRYILCNQAGVLFMDLTSHLPFKPVSSKQAKQAHRFLYLRNVRAFRDTLTRKQRDTFTHVARIISETEETVAFRILKGYAE